MRKTELELLTNIQAVTANHPLLVLPVRTPQHRFLLTYAALHFLRQAQPLPFTSQLLQEGQGSFSNLQLSLSYMLHCIERKQQLEDPRFRVLGVLVQWMENLQKVKSNKEVKLLSSILLPNPQRLPLHHYEELLVYLGYIGKDIQQLVKGGKVGAEDQLSLLTLLLPRAHFNIVLPADVLGREGKQHSDVLFTNHSLLHLAKTRGQYRMLSKSILKSLLSMTLSLSQHRQLLDRACRYYLLFWEDRQMTAQQLFLSVFANTPEAVRLSLSDELILFFRVAGKLGGQVERAVREKWKGLAELLGRFVGAVVGQPKDEVSPFNSLGVRQAVSVGAGKCVGRVIEIFHEYSLFYFWLGVDSHDINVRLYYLGDFQSKVEVKKLLLSEDKLTAESRSAFMATRRGLYLLEMDNSYSWINAKNIKLQVVVLSPHSHAPTPNWLTYFFQTDSEGKRQQQKEEEKEESKQQKMEIKKDKVEVEVREQKEVREEVIVKQLVVKEQKKEEKEQKHHASSIDANVDNTPKSIEKQLKHQQQATSSKQEQIIQPDSISSTSSIEEKIQTQLNPKPQNPTTIASQKEESNGQANLSLIDSIFSLLVSYTDHTYEFETNLDDRIIKRLQAYSQQKLTWIMNGQARDWLKRQKLKLGKQIP